jgi:peptidoglycan hydrolase-like protein with peptidoglycan-binding domain
MKRPLLFLVVILCAAGFVQADQTVRSLQQTLKDKGLYYGSVTGEKSAETTAAIRRYQIRNGLKVTGEINDETLRSLGSSSNSVAGPSQAGAKPASTLPASIRPDANSRVTQSSPPPLTEQPGVATTSSGQPGVPATNPLSAASFYQSAPVHMNRRIIAEAQYQLMSRGYYRGRIDGSYGRQTAVGLRAFQSTSGLVPTGRFDMQTLNVLGLSDTDLAHAAPASRPNETWIPVTKFKHGKWKVKWKQYHRPWGGEHGDDDQQANNENGWNGYNDD